MAAPPRARGRRRRSSCRRCSRRMPVGRRSPAQPAVEARRQRQAGLRPRVDLVAQQVHGARIGRPPRPAREPIVGVPASTLSAIAAAPASSRAWQSITARRRQSTCSAKVGPAARLPSCAGRRAGRAPGRRSGAAGSARSRPRRRARAGRRCGDGGRGARPSCRSRAGAAAHAQLAARLGLGVGDRVVEQRGASSPTRSRLRDVDVEAPLQLAHRGVADVLAAGAGRPPRRVRRGRRSRPGAARRAPASARRCRSAWPACRGSARPPPMTARRSSFRPGSDELVGAAGLEAALHQPAQAGRRDAAVADAARREHLRDRADGARRAERLAPVARRERLQRFLELGAGGDLRGAEARARVKRPSPKYFIDRLTLPTWNDSARSGRVPRPRIISVERPPMSMTSRGTRRRLQPRHAGIDQARLLASGDRPRSEGRARSARAAGRRRGCAASRSVCVATARTWRGTKPSRRAREAGQAVEPARRGLVVEQAVGIEAGAEAHGFLQVVDAPVAAVRQLADLEPEAVRAHVDRRELAGPARFGAARGRRGLHGGDCRGSSRATGRREPS